MKDAGYSYAAIAAEASCDWRTAKKYLQDDHRIPPTYRPRPPQSSGSRATSRCTGGFETIAGAQAQIDWGDEGTILTPAGEVPVYSFHMC